MLMQGSEYFSHQKAEEGSHLLIDMDDSWLASSPSQPGVPERQYVQENEPSAKDNLPGRELVRVEHQDKYHSESDSKTAMSEISRENSSIDEMCGDDEELDRKLEEAFGFANVEEFLEPYMAVKSLQKKTVQFAQAILDVKINNEDNDKGDEVFSDSKDRNSVTNTEGSDIDGYDDELEVLRLRDVRGQVFNLPFQYARTWEVCIFCSVHFHNIKPHVQS
jgi:hypothetical protein